MKTFLPAVRLLLALTFLTGIVYPLLITGIAHELFPRQAGGSLLASHGRIVGSALLPEKFSSNKYFWPRPSAGDDGTNYVAVPSSASNFGPTSSNLVATAQSRLTAFKMANGLESNAPVPAEMVFASGSGLDPDISPEAARLQINRVAAARNFSQEQKRALSNLVHREIEPPQFGFLGEPRVNVLLLNLALDSIK